MAISVEKRGNGFRAAVNVSGVRRKLGTHATKEIATAVARAGEAQLRLDIVNGTVTPKQTNAQARAAAQASGGMTAAKWATKWREEHPLGKQGEERAESTWYGHNSQIRAFINDPVMGSKPMSQVTIPEAQRWYNKRPSDRDGLRVMWSDAIRSEDITGVTRNPWKEIVAAKKGSRKGLRMLSADQYVALLEAAVKVHGPDYGEVFATFLAFQAWTAMRPSETIALTWDDIDFDQGIIHVRHNLSRDAKGAYTVQKLPKNGLAREIILPPAIRDRLLALPRMADHNLVFWNKRGKLLTPSTRANLWAATKAVALNIPEKWDLYSLRHLGITWMVTPVRFGGMGLDAADAAVQAGHTDGGDLVRKLYGHVEAWQRLETVREAMVKAHQIAPTNAESVPQLQLDSSPKPAAPAAPIEAGDHTGRSRPTTLLPMQGGRRPARPARRR